jgi:hypothetical protein
VSPWRQAPLFSAQLDSVSINRQSASTLPLQSSLDVLPTTSPAVLAPHSEGLFVHRSNEVRGR